MRILKTIDVRIKGKHFYRDVQTFSIKTVINSHLPNNKKLIINYP